jgi:hypothetical protein
VELEQTSQEPDHERQVPPPVGSAFRALLAGVELGFELGDLDP